MVQANNFFLKKYHLSVPLASSRFDFLIQTVNLQEGRSSGKKIKTMESPIHVFEPNTFKSTMITLVFCLLVLIGLFLLFYLNKKDLTYQQKKRKGMFSMLLVTGILLASATAILNFWNSFQYKEVKIFQDRIQLPTAEVPFKDIHKTYIYVHRPPTIVSPPPDSLMNYDHSLFIEEYDKTRPMHILPEENYPIFEIIDKLNSEMKK